MRFEGIFGELLETFWQIFEDFWIFFDALIRAVKAIRAHRAVRAVRVVRAVRALYKESGEQGFPHSCLDCHRKNITRLRCFEAFFASG